MIGNLLRVSNTELESYLENSSLLEERIYENDSEDPNLIDIDKSWEGIIFLLTGQNLEKLDHPLGKVLFSGQLIDEEQDLGYGPGHYLNPDQVKEVNAQLSQITSEELKDRFDSKQMTALEIYPNIWDDESIVDYLTDYYKTVQEVYSTAAKNNEAVITFLN